MFRAEHALMVFIAILLTELVVAGELTTSSVLAALGPVFVTLGAFAFNDYSGFKSDSALKRIDRPIVAGKISRKQALGASLILFALGNALALLFAPLIGFLIVVFFAVFSVLYDLYLKKLPLIGNVFVASTYSASYFYFRNGSKSRAPRYHPSTCENEARCTDKTSTRDVHAISPQ